jgi:hypothetical protein
MLTLSPLMPIVHWPTFSQQLVAREDEKSETWRAFLLSLGKLVRLYLCNKLIISDILDYPAASINPDFPARQGAKEAASAVPYRI